MPAYRRQCPKRQVARSQLLTGLWQMRCDDRTLPEGEVSLAEHGELRLPLSPLCNLDNTTVDLALHRLDE